MKTNYEEIMKKMIYGFKDLSKQCLNGIFQFDLNNFFLSKVQEINAIYGQQQVENILLTLNYIHESSQTTKEKIDKTKEKILN